MEPPFEGRDDFDLSLEGEYLSSGMQDVIPFCAGLNDFLPDNRVPQQTHQSFWDTVNDECITASNGMDKCDSGIINPDDFLNDVSCDSAHSLCNRDTPSPSNSQKSYDSSPTSGGFEGSHVVPMRMVSLPNSSQTACSPTNGTNAVKPNSGMCHLKIVPKSLYTTINRTKTITKKTIVLSVKDYRALLANMQQQPSSNTIILKATPTNKLPIRSVVKSVQTASLLEKQEIPFVLPKPTSVSATEVETKYESESLAAIKKDRNTKTFSQFTVPMMLAAGTTLSEHTIDEKLLKKHQRMIKNRQSAYESRQKKKEYVTSLEKRLEQLSQENQQLKVENLNLLEKLKMQCTCAAVNQPQGHSTMKQVSPTARKNTAIVLAMLFMVSLNFYPIGNLLTNSDPVEMNQLSDKVVTYHSRGLLWMNDSSNLNDRSRPRSYRDNLTVFNELTNEDSIETLPVTECPFYVNQTENIRLASELRRWIGENGYKNLTNGMGQAEVSIDTFDKMFRLKDTIDSMYQHMKDISMQLKSYERQQMQAQSGKKLSRNRQRKAPGQRQMMTYRKKIPNQHDVDLYYPKIHVKYAEFFEEIGRRDDTFYLVSFSEEHLLLPALAYNKTNRPRMSLMLPTVTASSTPMSNGTNRSDKITLMQIDCEVMNTSVIQIREKMIPGALRPQGDETAKGGSGDNGSRDAANPGVHTKRSSGTSVASKLERINSSTMTHATEAVDDIQQKRNSVRHQHVPTRPFFVHRMNEHLSEHH
ncbi:cyclic AMP-dependent transcription factor ATF-6 alpha [Anopheles marshallii]|uniref:cyclic AMP-dependent transcription factor ATF-6 alpha n=1 Tax=Anopheles marshallii TaxID=1521116 RepID=UPI00237B1AC2|nr:cyclic AMP-dependent transcription factor ATF-6 alpha [Anopheles marshallii]